MLLYLSIIKQCILHIIFLFHIAQCNIFSLHDSLKRTRSMSISYIIYISILFMLSLIHIQMCIRDSRVLLLEDQVLLLPCSWMVVHQRLGEDNPEYKLPGVTARKEPAPPHELPIYRVVPYNVELIKVTLYLQKNSRTNYKIILS